MFAGRSDRMWRKRFRLVTRWRFDHGCSCCRCSSRRGEADRRNRAPRGSARGRGVGAAQGDRSLSHRRVHVVGGRSGRDLSGHPRSRRCGHRGRRGEGRDLGEEGRSRDPALHAGVSSVRLLPASQDQSLPSDSRDAGARTDARRDEPLLPREGAGLPLHGHVDLRRVHRAPRNRPRQSPRRRALRQDLLHRLRGHHRHRRGHLHRQRGAGIQGGGLRSGRHRSQCDSRALGWQEQT